jgi:hypothetical protein
MALAHERTQEKLPPPPSTLLDLEIARHMCATDPEQRRIAAERLEPIIREGSRLEEDEGRQAGAADAQAPVAEESAVRPPTPSPEQRRRRRRPRRPPRTSRSTRSATRSSWRRSRRRWPRWRTSSAMAAGTSTASARTGTPTPRCCSGPRVVTSSSRCRAPIRSSRPRASCAACPPRASRSRARPATSFVARASAPVRTSRPSCATSPPTSARRSAASGTRGRPAQRRRATRAAAPRARPAARVQHGPRGEPRRVARRAARRQRDARHRRHARRATQIAIYPAEAGAPEWACGRYHECIGSILQFPDLQRPTRSPGSRSRPPRTASWDVVLDRQRRLMLQEILELVGRQLGKSTARGRSARAARPSPPRARHVGAGRPVWRGRGHVQRLPIPLGTNLRCKACRRASCLGRKQAQAADQARRSRGHPRRARGAARSRGRRCGPRRRRRYSHAQEPARAAHRRVLRPPRARRPRRCGPLATSATRDSWPRSRSPSSRRSTVRSPSARRLPPDFPRAYFDAFVVRMRPTLEAMVGAWLRAPRGPARRAAARGR